ncbi:uncharacterized protein LOC108892867 [Lates japonicus]|uniref:Ig-like domain-containing protein n=1 Tax=Lates japonicus TaxID=270547 RepID=A0AAD3N1I9_LATJO|nr:uncharacterized protein AKAME5_001499500 [Lates japonicus]
MRPTVLAGWFGVFLSLVFAQADGPLYKKVGDEVILKPNPGSVTGAITAIVWKDGLNIAMQWEKLDLDIIAYRQFKERGSLNTTNGEMTITGLLRDDSASYTVHINGGMAGKTDLRVLSPVPVPTVSKACDDEKTRCTLICEGDTTGVDEVIYMWKSGDVDMESSSKELHIKKGNDSSIKWFSCELINPVSQESSKPIANPFPPEFTSLEEGPKISAGLTVFICLLSTVLVLALVHRFKAGMWFFEKASMPWEADFWRKQERPPRDAAESNGTTAHQEKGQDDEETPMT